MLKKVKKIAKNLLAIPLVRAVYKRGTYVVLAIFASNRILATLYAIPGFLTFNREQYFVLRGRRDYYRNLSRDRRTSIELRRSIHCLEKGIIMQPMYDIFAKDYIGETIEFYERAVAQYREYKESCDTTELEWASSVLSRYFELSATGDERVDGMRDRFTKIKDAYESSGKSDSFKISDRKPPETKVQKKLGLGPDERVIMLIAIGYADPVEEIPYSMKKNVTRFTSYSKVHV